MLLKLRLLFIILLFTLAGGCTSANVNKFPTVVDVSLSPTTFPEKQNPNYGFDYVLSYDGKSIWLPSIEKVELASGKLDHSFIDSVGPNYQGNTSIQPIGGFFDWSVDGHYLATTNQDVDMQKDIIHRFVYITDTQTKTIKKLEGVTSFRQWSPVNDQRLLVGATQGRNLWDVSKNIGLPLRDIIDFRQSKSILGNREYLWDGELNTPIAKLISQADATSSGQRVLGISSFRVPSTPDPNPDPDAIFKSVITLRDAQRWGAPIFDPTGQYILMTIAEPDFSSATHIADSDTEITDTVLLLINWRTKEKTELFRLSSFDPKHVVVNDIAWSGDGSTILILRKDASPIVLKIKYP